MNYDIVEALSQIAREKGVNLEILKDRVEASLLSAAKKKHGLNAQITVDFDSVRGGIEMNMTKTVVGKVTDRGLEITAAQARAYKADAAVGDEIVINLDVAEFGRNAVLAAKQVLIQGVREAERERVYTDFADRVGSVVRGVVQQVDRGSIILKLDTAEAIIPAREVMHRDRFRQREMVRALVLKVDKEARGPQVILSRTHPDFMVRLFEAEVPEIMDKVVEVKAVAREAGHRSKIAVVSHDTRIDAVGACVGIKGSRVQAIVKELGGERIDIVPWSGDAVVFVSRSLSPAKVVNARVDEGNHQVTVIVPDDQLSLAIGKQGQNVRLAAKLTGWKIELHSQSEFEARSAAAEADVPVGELEGVSEAVAEALEGHGIQTASDIEKLGLEDLVQIPELPELAAERLYGVALAALATARAEAAAAAVREMLQAEAEEAEGAEADEGEEAEADETEEAEADEAEEAGEETALPAEELETQETAGVVADSLEPEDTDPLPAEETETREMEAVSTEEPEAAEEVVNGGGDVAGTDDAPLDAEAPVGTSRGAETVGAAEELPEADDSEQEQVKPEATG